MILVVLLFNFDFLKVDIPPERAALGGAGICRYDDGYTTIENPAGLSLCSLHIFSTSVVQYLAGTYFGLISYQYHPYGIAVEYFNSGSMKKTDEDGHELGTFMAQFLNAVLGRGLNLGKLKGGGAINFVYQRIDNYTSLAAAANGGVIYQSEPFTIGAVVKLVGYEFKPYRETRDPLPLTFGFGFGFTRPRFGGYLDLEKPLEDPLLFSIGMWGEVCPHLRLLAGYNSKLGKIKTNSTLDFISGASLGVTLRIKKFRIGYSITPYADLGLSNRLSFSILF
ncbi:hypothetical protein DRP53_02905 [candidate division WOR-3 bacterium]|uniref:PorV/PorQ family protein n=1 Tax=candidate division WOR-3 bacterium TaxID=2052148 RepID=A0A660SJM7_UNCW3|nr:MAG: hypothetical protein DRP53_02905 [candidate division WOR-3 bacterium]